MKKAFLFLLLPFILFAREYDYHDLVDRVKDRFMQSIELYKDGKQSDAQEVAQSAYFELFENLEGPIRINVSGKKAWTMERKFTKIRNLIKQGASLSEIEETINSLNADMDEVLPKLKDGSVIVAESSSNDAIEESKTMDIRWQTVFDNIDEKFSLAVEALRDGEKAKAKNYIRTAQFEDYRNTMAETAIRKYVAQKDGKIQNEIRRIIISIDSLDNHMELQNALSRVKMDIFLALNELPPEAAELAKVSVAGEDNIVDDGTDYYKVLANIRIESQKAFELHKNGDNKKAIMAMQNVYFDIFESTGMEVRIGAIDSALKLTIEATFSEIVALMKKNAPHEDIEKALEKLYFQVEIGAGKLQTKSTSWDLFIYALVIILREGLEALIVVTAVIAFLIKSGNKNRLGIVYSSLWIAIGLSFVTAFVMNYVLKTSGQSQELLEGITMLIAVVLLFYVGFWLLSNAHAKKWAQYISGKVKDSISDSSAKALWFTVFLAVYREGAETVLFYQALIFDAKDALGYGMIAAGLAVGIVILIVIFFLLRAGAIKIPIKPFFMITSMIIFYMCIVFTGKGIMELVEAKMIEPSIIHGLPTITWLGFYPYIESLIPQAILLISVVIGSFYIIRKSKRELYV